MNRSELTSNLAVLRGTITTDPLSRDLPSGKTVVQFDVSTTVVVGDKATKASVPVSWVDPPPKGLEPVEQGLDVLVVGTVRRRFFRAGGTTQSRTEVVVDSVVPARRAKQAQTLLAATAARMVADL